MKIRVLSHRYAQTGKRLIPHTRSPLVLLSYNLTTSCIPPKAWAVVVFDKDLEHATL